jgi:hypothetical protein
MTRRDLRPIGCFCWTKSPCGAITPKGSCDFGANAWRAARSGRRVLKGDERQDSRLLTCFPCKNRRHIPPPTNP